jgi:hypothetical protein
VVRHVRLGDTVKGDGSEGAEEVAVHGGEGAAGKGPLFGRVVGYKSVLVNQSWSRAKDIRRTGSVCCK